MIIDTTKAEFIKNRFAGSKIGIFYVFKEEYNALIQVFGAENLTNDLDEFNSTDKNIALQVISGREGVSLRNADSLVFYNIQHSAVSYFQARDRLTHMGRLENKVYWVFTEGGIEDKIFKVVKSKKKYTLNIFKKDYECIGGTYTDV
jgi:tRNA(His) 5'-end guanylyltransferase